MHKVGFIGIGAMGRWMVKNLINEEIDLVIYDVNAEALEEFKNEEVKLATSISEVGAHSDVVILMLPNSKIVRNVVFDNEGLKESMKEDSIIIDMSSSYALETKKMKALLSDWSIRLIDAPVSGGVPKAKSGELTIMVGGAEEDFKEVSYIFNILGTQISLIGDIGSGHALKAINNYLSAASMYATAEALMLAKRLGISPEIAIEAINTSTGKSHSSQFKYPTYVLPRDFTSNFSLDLQLKDIVMAKNLATDVHLPMLLGSPLIEIFESAVSMGGVGQDHTEIIKFLEAVSKEQLT